MSANFTIVERDRCAEKALNSGLSISARFARKKNGYC